jgi:hypothetical protein
VSRFVSCSRCGGPAAAWQEETFLHEPPAWWPPHVPYEPVHQTATQSLCLWCGRHTEEID